MKWCGLVAILVAVARVQGFGAGAPPTRCGDMFPNHAQLNGQMSTPPFTVTTSATSYMAGDVITVSIQAAPGRSFKGLLVQAVNGDSRPVGRMTPPAGYKNVACGPNGDEAITHTNNVVKNIVTIQYITPDTSNGDLDLLLTIVQDYTTFWVRQQMATLAAASTPSIVSTGLGSGTAELTTQSTLTFPPPLSQDGVIQYDPQCGSSKGCFLKCDGGRCQFMVTWRDVGNSVTFELYGKPAQGDSWIAVGFSSDSRMGEDSVTECVHNSGVVQAFNSYNPGFSNTRLENPQYGLADVFGSYKDGVLRCTFTRAKTAWNESGMFDLNQDWNIMFAMGRALPEFKLSMHSISSGQLPPASASRVDFQSFAVIGSGASFPLVKVHGCLMVFAWVLLTGIGLVIARYYKSVWADKKLFKLHIWFQVHRACMVSALVVNVTAFVLIFVEVKGYSEIADIAGKSYLRAHPVLGIIITVLVMTNPVMALFRPGPTHARRFIFNWAHWAVGMTAYILSAICICFGFQLAKSSTPDYAVYIMAAYVIYILLFDVAFEVLECLNRRSKKGKVESLEMTRRYATDTPGISNGTLQSKNKHNKNDKMKTILLAVHIAFTGAFALILVLVVALN